MRRLVGFSVVLAVVAGLAAAAALAAGGTAAPALQISPVGRLPFPERGTPHLVKSGARPPRSEAAAPMIELG